MTDTEMRIAALNAAVRLAQARGEAASSIHGAPGSYDVLTWAKSFEQYIAKGH